MAHHLPVYQMKSSIRHDGSRATVHPADVHGRFNNARRVVFGALLAVYLALPWIRLGGNPAVLLDLPGRRFYLMGRLFNAQDGFLLFFLLAGIGVSLILVTTILGRVWCGWACPQTVYLELVFRPIERLWEGSPSAQRKLDDARLPSWRRVGKWVTYAALAFAVANVFLAYFVGTDRLERWITHSPAAHPFGFGVVVAVSALMWFDFAWFREQTCIVACPYGRLQSVLIDRQSLIVGYDSGRGEPRGKPRKALPVIDEPRGDCVDCGNCVTTCPTGIDIRAGLQMECIGCTQCIDACDHVMDKLGRARGLIRYTSQDELAGKPRRVWRVRTFVYPALLVLVGALLVWGIGGHTSTEVTVQRPVGPTFVELPDGRVAAQVRLKLENQSGAERRYTVTLVETEVGTLRTPRAEWTLAAGKAVELPLFVDVARREFRRGQRVVHLRVADDHGWTRTLAITLIGPDGAP